MAMAESLLRQCVRETIKIISFREEHQVLHGPKPFLRPLMIVPRNGISKRGRQLIFAIIRTYPVIYHK